MGNLAVPADRKNFYRRKRETQLIDFELLLKTDDLESVAARIIESSYEEVDFMRMDTLDRLLDFIYFKVQTGYMYIPHMAYATKRMMDRELESKVIDLLNIHLYPEIVLKLLRFFTRNINNSDSNLFFACLIKSEEIVRSIYDTFLLFKKDIFITDPNKRVLNVKRIQQFSSKSEIKLSSPLDACARLKYILEFFIINQNVNSIYSREDLLLSRGTG